MQTCCVCLDEKQLIPLETCSHGICPDCIVSVFRRNPRCPLCRDNGIHRASDSYSSESSRGDLLDEDSQDEPVLQLSSQYLNQILVGHRDDVTAVAVFADGTRVVSGNGNWNGADCSVKIWDVTSGAELCTMSGHSNRVTAVAVFPDGSRIVSGSVDESVKVWDATSGEYMRTLVGHCGDVIGVAVFPDCSRIVSGSADWSVKVWDATSGENLLTLAGHNDYVCGVAMFADGTRVVSGSYDGTVKIWNL